MPEFYMTFARKMPEFYIIIARKIFFPNFRGARAPLLPPVSYAYDRTAPVKHLALQKVIHSLYELSSVYIP